MAASSASTTCPTIEVAALVVPLTPAGASPTSSAPPADASFKPCPDPVAVWTLTPGCAGGCLALSVLLNDEVWTGCLHDTHYELSSVIKLLEAEEISHVAPSIVRIGQAVRVSLARPLPPCVDVKVALLFKKANKIVEDSKWTKWQFPGSETGELQASSLTARKMGRLVMLDGESLMAVPADGLIGVLPDRYRPTQNHRFIVAATDSGLGRISLHLSVKSDGSVWLLRLGGGETSTASVAWFSIAGAGWLV